MPWLTKLPIPHLSEGATPLALDVIPYVHELVTPSVTPTDIPDDTPTVTSPVTSTVTSPVTPNLCFIRQQPFHRQQPILHSHWSLSHFRLSRLTVSTCKRQISHWPLSGKLQKILIILVMLQKDFSCASPQHATSFQCFNSATAS